MSIDPFHLNGYTADFQALCPRIRASCIKAQIYRAGQMSGNRAQQTNGFDAFQSDFVKRNAVENGSALGFE